MRDPNRTVKTLTHRDEAPDLKCGSGDAKKDGYSVLGHRPRSRWNDEIVLVSRLSDRESLIFSLDEF